MTSSHNALRAEIAGLHAQLEDLRQSKTVAALGRVASDASALLNDMLDADEIRAADESLESVGFDERRGVLSASLGAFTEAAEADLAAAGKRAVELENGPLAKELAAEKAAEDAVCPACHGAKKVKYREIVPGGEEIYVTCLRCNDPFDFGVPTAQVARGRNAS